MILYLKLKNFKKSLNHIQRKLVLNQTELVKNQGVAKVKQGPKLETIELDALEIKKSMPYQFEEIKSYMALKKTNNDDINFMIKNIKQEKLVESSTAFTNIQSTAIPTFTQNYNIPDLLQGTATNSANMVTEFWSSPNDVKTCLKNTRYTNALSSILNMQNIESAFSTFDTIFKLNYISKFNELFSERDNPSIKLIYSQLESQFSFIAKLLSREYAEPNNFNFTQKLEQEISANKL